MSNIPKLRFPEFSGDWEEKKLSDFMTRLTRKNSNNESSRALTISSVDGLIDQGEFFKKQIASKDTSGYYLLKKGDFAYNKSYSVGYDYGSIKRLDRYEDGVVSTLYICMSLTSDTNSDYLTHYFDSMKWNKSVSEISAEGARNHGLLNIPTEAFFQTKHFLAPSSQEQQKIADFLSNVDSIIAVETKILNTLQKKKKALMQKLFTQQLRFKSDDGTDFPAWEEKKVIDFAKVDTGANNTQDKVEDGPYPFFVRSPIIYRSNKYIFDFPEAVLTVGDGVGTGKVFHYVQGKFDCHQRVYVIHDFENVLGKYFYFYFSEKFYARVKPMSAKNSVDSVRREMITDMKIPIPCKVEQQKIADCLSSMDSLIQTQQKVVTTWQQRKKALLQQMFI